MTAAAGDLTDPAAEAEARLGLAHLSLQYAPADVVEQCQRALELPDVPDELRIHLLSFLSLGQDLFGDAAAAEQAARDATAVARASADPDNEVFTLVPRAAQALARGDWRVAVDLVGESAARRYSVQGSAVRLWLPDAWEALIAIVVARLDEAFALIEAGMKAAQREGISANIRVWSMLRCRALYCSRGLPTPRPRPRRRSRWRTRSATEATGISTMSPCTSWPGWPCIPGRRPGSPRPGSRRPGLARRGSRRQASASARGSPHCLPTVRRLAVAAAGWTACPGPGTRPAGRRTAVDDQPAYVRRHRHAHPPAA